MLKKATDTIIVAAVGFLIVLVTQIWNGYVAETTGSVILGPFLDSESSSSYLFTVENRKSAASGEIHLMLPETVDVDSIATTSPVLVERLASVRNPPGFQTITISGIQARTRVGLRIPLGEEERKSFELRVVNLNEIDLRLSTFGHVETPWKRIVLGAIALALLSAFMFGGFSYYMHRVASRLSAQLAQNRSDLEKLTKDNEESISSLTQRTKDISLRYARLRALQGRVLSHHMKELRFWRDTVRSTLRRENRKASDALLEEISRVLKTYSTHASADDFEKLEGLVEGLRETDGANSEGLARITTADGIAPPEGVS